ncbi:cystathionine gamma-lyase cys3 [Cryptotrichosporon argae]
MALHESDHFATRAIHVGSEPDPSTGAVVPSLSVATTFKQDGVGKHRGHEYSRTSNPTRAELERLLASLETSPSADDAGEAEALVFASGSAATAAIAHWATLARAEGGAGGRDGERGGGGHVLAVNDVYGGTARYLSRAAKPTGLEVTFLDMEAAGEAGIRAAIRPDTRIIWLEVPTNPLLLVPPLALIASIVRTLPNRPVVLVDTTFLSPFYITPLVAGPSGVPLADVVLSSLSKYGSGHSDLILGALAVSASAARAFPHLVRGLRFLQNAMGASASPRDCHLMQRSLKTLAPRMVAHGLGALRVAAWLDADARVEAVRYPGLRSDAAFAAVESLLSANARRELAFLGWQLDAHKHPPLTNGERARADADIQRKARDGTLDDVRTLGVPFGGVVAFRVRGADAKQTDHFVSGLRLIALAESLGGVESLVEVPAGMTHAGLPEATREALGITPNLIRLSVGIENAADLIADLDAGLTRLDLA